MITTTTIIIKVMVVIVKNHNQLTIKMKTILLTITMMIRIIKI